MKREMCAILGPKSNSVAVQSTVYSLYRWWQRVSQPLQQTSQHLPWQKTLMLNGTKLEAWEVTLEMCYRPWANGLSLKTAAHVDWTLIHSTNYTNAIYSNFRHISPLPSTRTPLRSIRIVDHYINTDTSSADRMMNVTKDKRFGLVDKSTLVPTSKLISVASLSTRRSDVTNNNRNGDK